MKKAFSFIVIVSCMCCSRYTFAQGVNIDKIDKLNHENARLSIGALLYHDGWGATVAVRHKKRPWLWGLDFREYIHPKEQRQINKQYIDLFPDERITPFYYKKQNNVYRLSGYWAREWDVYLGGNFRVFSRNGLGAHINLVKPVVYHVVYRFPDTSGAYEVRKAYWQDDGSSRMEQPSNILGREPLYKNLSDVRLSYGVQASVALGVELWSSRRVATGLLTGATLYAHTTRLTSLHDYPQRYAHASFWVGLVFFVKKNKTF